MPLLIYPARILDEEIVLRETLPAVELDLNEVTSRAKDPVAVALTVQRDGESLLVNGIAQTTVSLQCGRCGKWLDRAVRIDPCVHVIELPEARAEMLDLTPLVREDILLDLPTVAVCPLQNGKECRTYPQASDAPLPIHGEDVWKELDKIKEP